MSSPDQGLDAAKGRAVDLLAESFAQDQMTMEEFERRVGLVQEAVSMRELEEALDVAPGADGGQPRPFRPHASPSRPLEPAPKPVPPARVPESDRALAVFGEVKRTGRWMPARSTNVVSVFGSVVIDLREATLVSGEYRLAAWTVFGSVEVIVPPGVMVHCAGSAVAGNFEHLDPDPSGPSTGTTASATVLRLDGLALLGSVEATVRYAGESKREARRRRRIEKKQHRKLTSGRR